MEAKLKNFPNEALLTEPKVTAFLIMEHYKLNFVVTPLKHFGN